MDRTLLLVGLLFVSTSMSAGAPKLAPKTLVMEIENLMQIENRAHDRMAEAYGDFDDFIFRDVHLSSYSILKEIIATWPEDPLVNFLFGSACYSRSKLSPGDFDKSLLSDSEKYLKNVLRISKKYRVDEKYIGDARKLLSQVQMWIKDQK